MSELKILNMDLWKRDISLYLSTQLKYMLALGFCFQSISALFLPLKEFYTIGKSYRNALPFPFHLTPAVPYGMAEALVLRRKFV